MRRFYYAKLNPKLVPRKIDFIKSSWEFKSSILLL